MMPGVSIPDESTMRTVPLDHEIQNPRLFTQRILATCAEVAIVGTPVSDQDMVRVLSKGLVKLTELTSDPAFKALAESDGTKDFQTLSQHLGSLMDSKERNAFHAIPGPSHQHRGGGDTNSAFYAAPTEGQRGTHPQPQSCTFCNKRGHSAIDCFSRKKREAQGQPTGAPRPGQTRRYTAPRNEMPPAYCDFCKGGPTDAQPNNNGPHPPNRCCLCPTLCPKNHAPRDC